MNTLTLLPAAVETKVKPKPTKAEVTTALALLHIQQCHKQNADNKEKRTALAPKIKSLMERAIRKLGIAAFATEANMGHISGETVNYVRMEVKFRDFTTMPELLGALREYHNADKHVSIPSLNEAKRQISRKMEGYQDTSTRVQMLIDSPDSRKALETMLAGLDK